MLWFRTSGVRVFLGSPLQGYIKTGFSQFATQDKADAMQVTIDATDGFENVNILMNVTVALPFAGS